MPKHSISGYFAAFGAALLLTACVGNSIDQASKISPSQNDTFAATLFNGYMSLAAAEQKEADFNDAEIFAARAITVAGGKSLVEPESISFRKLPDDKVIELTSARAELMSLFEKGARLEAPGAAADAQVGFDCWMQEQEENVQPKDIAACKMSFFDGMSRIKSYYASRVIEPITFTVYFDSGRSNIDDKDLANLGLAVALLEKYPNARAALSGHADRVGNPKSNLALSQERTQSVQSTLLSLGVTEARLSVESDGEDKPAIQTDDNVAEQANRRVEIHLYQ